MVADDTEGAYEDISDVSFRLDRWGWDESIDEVEAAAAAVAAAADVAWMAAILACAWGSERASTKSKMGTDGHNYDAKQA